MTTCQQCHSEWTWKESFLMVFSFKKAVVCPYCDKEQYLTRRARNNLSVIPSIVALLWLPMIAFQVPISVIIPIEVVMAIGTVFILPYFFEVTDHNEPLW
ncbi:TIGR04104 family putative zinc finger protein [Pseudalkalibacillus sp. NRS-1564]|uniref:TIGR04104 family putative zinc finger protein n=1 Tax=Pseudalkalibacillus sp. NRS-1564 TaxID=3233900 RepID=UPI003D2E89C0